MPEYRGQPDYAGVAFLHDILEPWADVEGSEMGEYIGGLVEAASRAISISSYGPAKTLLDMALDKLVPLMEDTDFLETSDSEIDHAQSQFDKVYESHHESQYPLNREAVEWVAACLPAWFRPQPGPPKMKEWTLRPVVGVYATTLGEARERIQRALREEAKNGATSVHFP